MARFHPWLGSTLCKLFEIGVLAYICITHKHLLVNENKTKFFCGITCIGTYIFVIKEQIGFCGYILRVPEGLINSLTLVSKAVSEICTK